MTFTSFIFQDWKANKGNTKGRVILCLFRLVNYSLYSRLYSFFAWPLCAFYKLFVEWILGIGLPWNVRVGKNFQVYHGQALVVHETTCIGHNCILRQSTTIGNKQLRNGSFSDGPSIGNYVDVGSNVCIIGDIVIGDHVKIGCGSVVVKDVQSHSTAVGNPAATVIRLSNNYKMNSTSI